MSSRIEYIDEYDEVFFARLVELSNELNHHHPLHQEKTLVNSYQEFVSDHQFAQNNSWRSFVQINETGKIEACAIVTKPKNSSNDDAFLGYFEAREGIDLEDLFKSCENFARELKCMRIIGPIQGSIFNSYKFKLDEDCMMGGDPVHPTYYVNLWEKAGFKLIGTWENILGTRAAYLTKIFVSFLFAYRGRYLKVRPYDPGKREEEIRLLHELVMDSYSNMMAFVPISFEEFKYWNEAVLDSPFEKSFVFVEYESKPIGFNIDLKLPYIKKTKSPELRMQFAYVGKKRGLGKMTQGVADIVMRYHIKHRILSPIGTIPLLTGIYEKSPFRYWLLKSGNKVVGRYGLFGKNL